MKGNIKLELNFEEKNIILNALITFRNYLTTQNKTTDSVDEIILRISDKNKVELDILDIGIIINALNTMRYKLKDENEPRTEINDILLKVIEESSKKKLILRKNKNDNDRRI